MKKPISSILLLFIVTCLLSCATLSVQADNTRLRNHIIEFANTHARDTYVAILKAQEPDVEITLIDTLFIGVITQHSTTSAFAREQTRLKEMRAMDQNSIVHYEEDQVITLSETQNNAPWHLDRIDQRSLPLNDKFDLSNTNDEVHVYVLDTGIRISHNEFEGRASGAYSAISGPADEDCHGHGTHVAGIVGGKISGVNKRARLYAVRVLDCRGSGSTTGIIRAMEWVAQNAKKPAVANMSLGGGKSSSLNRAVQSMARQGVLPVVAAGNENTDACNTSPASAPEALTVGSTTNSDARSSFSNYGSCVDIYAPGSSIRSAGIGSDSEFKTMSGTSMASPVVCGIASVILQKNPSFTASQLHDEVTRVATVNEVSSSIRPFSYLPEAEQSCPDGYGGSNCDQPICDGKLANDPTVCSGNGACVSPNRCQCSSGYTGPSCSEFLCFGRPKYDPEVCSGNGMCVGLNQCQCESGFSGAQCELPPKKTCFGRDADSPLVCSGHGQCVDQNQCECNSGYFGTQCEQYTCFGKSPYDENACNGNGLCVDVDQCLCNGNYTGSDCSILSQPSKGKLIALINGKDLKVASPERPLVLDATYSHALPSFSALLNKKAANAENYQWTCRTILNNSKRDDICGGMTFPNDSILTLSPDALKSLEGGTYVFTLRYTQAGEVAYASNAVVVEKCSSWKTSCGCACE